MERLAPFVPWLLLGLYGAATAVYGRLFFQGAAGARRLASPLLQATVALHLAWLVWLTWRWQQFPGATVSQALSIVAFAVAIVYVFLEWLGGERATGGQSGKVAQRAAAPRRSRGSPQNAWPAPCAHRIDGTRRASTVSSTPTCRKIERIQLDRTGWAA